MDINNTLKEKQLSIVEEIDSCLACESEKEFGFNPYVSDTKIVKEEAKENLVLYKVQKINEKLYCTGHSVIYSIDDIKLVERED